MRFLHDLHSYGTEKLHSKGLGQFQVIVNVVVNSQKEQVFFLSFRLTPSVRILFIRGFCLIPSPVSFLTVRPLPKNLPSSDKVTAQYGLCTKCLSASCSIVSNNGGYKP